ncbi:MAG: sulfite exporter TauE/SafE family protein [Cytophagaceae bacterium]|jgi:hypothetical protein|nr:sulfite exporter TauE/SafE family protein [Cytophagaceae bacterium]
MNLYWLMSALALGLGGSLHCVGMCGPLWLRVANNSVRKATFYYYQSGRVGVYALLGLLAGLAGRALDWLLPMQHWFSLLAGILLLLVLLVNTSSFFLFLSNPIRRYLLGWQSKIQSPIVKSVLAGMVNGILPCGLVYAATVASIGAGSWWASMLFMILFGWGTLPIWMLWQYLSQHSFSTQRPTPMIVMKALPYIAAVLLILRGVQDLQHHVHDATVDTSIPCTSNVSTQQKSQ